MDLQFEQVTCSIPSVASTGVTAMDVFGGGLYRARVPGGWILRTSMTKTKASTTTFYPDPDHVWGADEATTQGGAQGEAIQEENS